MTLPEAIYQHSLRLPEHAAREAFDFIQFLEQRCATAAPPEPIMEPEAARKEALAHLATVRISWGGKPIADRNRRDHRPVAPPTEPRSANSAAEKLDLQFQTHAARFWSRYCERSAQRG